jgi:hypothetical protein
LFLVTAAFGAGSEILAVEWGLWTGSSLIPLWLVIGWGSTGACLYRLGMDAKKLLDGEYTRVQGNPEQNEENDQERKIKQDPFLLYAFRCG